MKKPTNKEKIKMYEQFLHLINTALVCGRKDIVQNLVSNANNWSYAHRIVNDKLTKKQRRKDITKKFWKLCNVYENRN